MTPPRSTADGLHTHRLSPADWLLREERLGRRQSLRRSLIALLVVTVVSLLVGVSAFIGHQLRTAWWLERLGCRVDWRIDETNWREGGATSVSSRSLAVGADLRDVDVRFLLDLHRLHSLSLPECDSLTDTGLAVLGGLNGLTELNLARLNRYRYAQLGPEQTTLTDACLASLGSLSRLEDLTLSGNQITDDGLAQIATLTNLKNLELDATEISDAGLIHLQGMKSLQSVSLAATRVTPAGVKKLREDRPDLTVTTDTEPAIEQGVKLRRGASR